MNDLYTEISKTALAVIWVGFLGFQFVVEGELPPI